MRSTTSAALAFPADAGVGLEGFISPDELIFPADLERADLDRVDPSYRGYVAAKKQAVADARGEAEDRCKAAAAMRATGGDKLAALRLLLAEGR